MQRRIPLHFSFIKVYSLFICKARVICVASSATKPIIETIVIYGIASQSHKTEKNAATQETRSLTPITLKLNTSLKIQVFLSTYSIKKYFEKL